MTDRVNVLRRLTLAALTFGLVATLFASPTPSSAHAIISAQLHPGTCDDRSDDGVIDLGELTYAAPLEDISAATPAGPYRPVGPDSAFVSVMTVATIEMSVDQLLAEPHSIDVQIINDETGERIPLACGDVGGVRNGDDLVFGLQTAPSEGVDTTGIVWLHGNPDGTTLARIFVSQGLGTAPEGTPAG